VTGRRAPANPARRVPVRQGVARQDPVRPRAVGRGRGIARVARAGLARAALLAVAWWAVSEGDLSVAGYGAAVVPLVTAASLALVPAGGRPLRLLRRIPPALRLAGWFLWRTVLGGVDVALRAVRTPVDTDPVLLEHRLTLPRGAARVLCADLSTLMPGALSVDLRGDVLVLHVLDRRLPARAQVDELERRIAAVLDA